MDHVNEKHEADPQKSTPTTCQQIMQSPRHMNSHKEKLEGFEFWKKDLNGAKLIVAPMVDQSELAWRLLSRRHGAQLCYSPMYHAAVFVKNATYRKESLASCAEDKPLIVQFCANDPDTFLTAAKLAEPYCEAVDLNLGCPQAIAKRGHYGAFLQEEWDLVCRMVNICHRELKIPVTCKMRILEDMDKTVQNAKRLEEAGCQLLAVHGRRREQKGPLTGLADWKFIKAIKEALSIPVIANGNIQSLADVHRCIEETGVDGVMTAEGNLHNPCLLEGKNPPIWEMAEEYLAFVDLYPCPASYIRGHLFKLFHHALQRHLDAREVLAVAKSVEDFKQATKLLKEKCMADVEAYEQDPSSLQCNLQLPYWLCQPYFRPSPEEAAQRSKDNDKNQRKRPLDVVNLERDGEKLSKNKLKKRSRNPNKKFEPRVCQYEICSTCGNPKGMKCLYSLCKKCCRQKAHREMLDCPGHNIMFKTKHEKWLKKQAEENIGNSAKKDSPTEMLHKCEVISNSEKDSAIS